MSLTAIADVWDLDLATLPRRTVAQVYIERAKSVLPNMIFEARGSGVLAFSRKVIAERIGCSRSSLSQNSSLSSLIHEAESVLRNANSPSDPSQRVNSASSRIRSRKDLRSSRGLVQGRDHIRNGWIIAGCCTFVTLAGATRVIPALIWPQGIDEDASDWFRHLALRQDVAPSTVIEYAKVLRLCLRRCRRLSADWREIDDQWLMTWRLEMASKDGVSRRRANLCLSVAFKFLLWAQRDGRIENRVGAYDAGDRPESMVGKEFAVGAKRSGRRTLKGQQVGEWQSSLIANVRGGVREPRHTPTEAEVRRIHAQAANSRQAVRDQLILSWAEEAGARRGDQLQIQLKHLPAPMSLAMLIEEDRPFLIPVLRKGRRDGHLVASPDLLVRTLDFVDHDRKEIVERVRKTHPGYVDEGFLFISSRTGKVLHPDSLTSIGRAAFRRAGVEKANIHRLRARYAQNIVGTLVDAVFNGDMAVGSASSWVETILTKAAESMGHSSPSSLKPYLGMVLDSRMRESEVWRVAYRESRLAALERREAQLENSPSMARRLQAAKTALEQRDYATAMAEMMALIQRTVGPRL